MRIALAGILIAAAAVSTAAASPNNSAAAVVPNVAASVGCVLTGAAAATSIIIANSGNVPIAVGTKVHWAMDGIAYQGDYTLTAPLPAGQTVVGFQFPAVLGNSLKGGVACHASLAQARSP